MSHQWTMEDFESIYSRFKSSGLSVMDFCSNECIRPVSYTHLTLPTILLV